MDGRLFILDDTDDQPAALALPPPSDTGTDLSVLRRGGAMHVQDKRVLVTGGAGFVGSHLVDRLVDANEVVVLDDLSNGSGEWVAEGATLVDGDAGDPDVLADVLTADVDLVFHFAADRSVEGGDVAQFRGNHRLTEAVVERMAEVGVENIAFTSSSTVYGEAPRPTPEDYAPMEPISVYGASKLGEEALLSVYAHSHDLTAWVYRFANIVGPRLQEGAVVPDFIEKLKADPETLTILGDGRQEKSYMHVEDCIDAMLHVVEHAHDDFNVYNLGTRTTTSVTRIADLVADEMGLDPDYEFTGGDRGWTGDVPKMRLSIEKLAALGWEPTIGSEAAVERAAAEIVAERT